MMYSSDIDSIPPKNCIFDITSYLSHTEKSIRNWPGSEPEQEKSKNDDPARNLSDPVWSGAEFFGFRITEVGRY